MKGLARGLPYAESAQIGSMAATYALEHLGGQSHRTRSMSSWNGTRSTSRR